MSRSTGLTFTSRPARNSSDASSIALGRRIAKPGRCRTSRAVRVARELSTASKLCCAGKPRSPGTAPTFGRGQHSSARNIGRHMLRATYGDIGIVPIRPYPRRSEVADSPTRGSAPRLLPRFPFHPSGAPVTGSRINGEPARLAPNRKLWSSPAGGPDARTQRSRLSVKARASPSQRGALRNFRLRVGGRAGRGDDAAIVSACSSGLAGRWRGCAGRRTQALPARTRTAGRSP
jgi:hypothetical protein